MTYRNRLPGHQISSCFHPLPVPCFLLAMTDPAISHKTRRSSLWRWSPPSARTSHTLLQTEWRHSAKLRECGSLHAASNGQAQHAHAYALRIIVAYSCPCFLLTAITLSQSAPLFTNRGWHSQHTDDGSPCRVSGRGSHQPNDNSHCQQLHHDPKHPRLHPRFH